MASTLGGLGEWGMAFGLGSALGPLDKVADGLGTSLQNLLWITGKHIPGLEDVLHSTRAYLEVLFDYLLNLDAISADGPCPTERLIKPPLPVARLTFRTSTTVVEEMWEKCDEHSDVSPLVQRLLDAYRPIWVEHPDDLPALSMETLLRHSHLVPAPRAGGTTTLHEYREAVQSYGTGADLANLDIDDAFARGRSRPAGLPTYHGRALKQDGNTIHLEYFALRAGSFAPNAAGDIELDRFEHEGDGEGCKLVIRRRGKGDPWILAGVIFDSKHYKKTCDHFSPDDAETPSAGYLLEMEVDDATGRPLIYVAVGSHALCGQAGKRRLRRENGIKGFLASLGVDRYLERTDETTVTDYFLRTTAEPDVHQAVFTKCITWGKDVAMIGTSPYGGKDFVDIAGALASLDLADEEIWSEP